jgi:DNA end-binding protein Ku
MPRPSWSGHLRLSLVSCPISLVPATTETDRIRLNQINPATGNRISMKTVDSETGEEVDRSEIVKGYQYEKGQYVLLDSDELSSIQIESSKVLDLTTFVDRASVNPLYLDAPYYIHPESKTGTEAFRVIAQALKNKKKAAIGRIVLSSREHPVMVEPYQDGLLMSILRTQNEVRDAEYDLPRDKLDPEMVKLAETILDRFAGEWEPEEFHDRYQDALRDLVEAKIKGLPASAPRPAPAPSNVIDLMAALKQSLTAGPAKAEAKGNGKRAKKPAERDRRQPSMLLPVKGGGKRAAAEAEKQPEARPAPRRRKKA